MINKFKEWHTNLILGLAEKYNIGLYGLLWLAFLKGFLIGIIINEWIR
mgnify:FL=1|tara:strand:- start:2360 stop:2503 length:144 start_codon:yes stop_codon:yes gene_type:complete